MQSRSTWRGAAQAEGREDRVDVRVVQVPVVVWKGSQPKLKGKELVRREQFTLEPGRYVAKAIVTIDKLDLVRFRRKDFVITTSGGGRGTLERLLRVTPSFAECRVRITPR